MKLSEIFESLGHCDDVNEASYRRVLEPNGTYSVSIRLAPDDVKKYLHLAEDADVIKRYYGLMGKTQSVEEISRAVGKSEVEVQRIVSNFEKKVKQHDGVEKAKNYLSGINFR